MRGVLTFHSVDESGSVLSITPAQLDSLLQAVSASGHRIVPLQQLLESRAPMQVALSFDDGFACLLSDAAPVLERHRAPATVFVTTGYLGADNRWPTQPDDAPIWPLLSWEQLAELRERGFDVQSHSVSHPRLTELAPDALEQELAAPRQALRERLGVESTIFAYPYGLLDRRVVDATARHYRHAVTTCMGALHRGDDPLQLPRLDTYYLRDPGVHRHFGRKRFRAYVRARAALRRLKGHSGEARA